MQIRGTSFILSAALALALFGCQPKKPKAPPPELLDRIAAAEAVFQQLSELSPDDDDASGYNAIISEARAALEAGDYRVSMDKAERAHLEASRLYARLAYRKLMEYNPPTPLTYHYRKEMKNSDDAEAAGDIDKAIEAAEAARRQAELAAELQKQCLTDSQKRLAALKTEVELIYKPDYDLVMLYWRAVESLPERSCEKTRELVNELDRRVTDVKENTLVQKKVLHVYASSEYIRTYGEPYMYAEVTDKGLKNSINQIPVGTPVYFIRCVFLSKDKTYYYVEDSRNGVKGWMAEERVWHDRAMRR
jgi:tetratricopeptide (TPR) repeat protein